MANKVIRSQKLVIVASIILTILFATYYLKYTKTSSQLNTADITVATISPAIVFTITPIPTLRTEQIENERLECHRKGGDWQGRPFGRGYFCNMPQTDSGKSCTDGLQCLSGNCIADESSNGECSKYSVLYGCYTFLGKSPYQTNPRSSKIETNQVCID